MSYPAREGDLPMPVAAERIADVLKLPNATVYIKWTCPRCGDRVSANDPVPRREDGRVEFRPGYLHEEREDGTWCGCLYPTHENSLFGIMIIYQVTP